MAWPVWQRDRNSMSHEVDKLHWFSKVNMCCFRDWTTETLRFSDRRRLSYVESTLLRSITRCPEALRMFEKRDCFLARSSALTGR
jgi:hypothetical protein